MLLKSSLTTVTLGCRRRVLLGLHMTTTWLQEDKAYWQLPRKPMEIRNRTPRRLITRRMSAYQQALGVRARHRMEGFHTVTCRVQAEWSKEGFLLI